MNHFDFPRQFGALYLRAVERYATGQRGVASFFDANECAFLKENGLSPQSLYDYAEDHAGYGGEPGQPQALAIELVRRDYFLNVQQGRPSDRVIDPAGLPGKAELIDGIPWLARLLPKAQAKLRGELPSSLMFCCGGDRHFFREHNILPAEFLTQIGRNENNLQAIIPWIRARAVQGNQARP
ncbi:MAG: hypothetical protein RL077_1582 [Verrucomicrobiota bacterium]|jgi:hypothetical protein